MKTIFVNKTKRFEIRFQYNFMISNDFIMRINSKILLIIKRIINLNVDINEKITISLLSVLNNDFYDFNSYAIKTIIFNEIFFKIKMKLNKSLISFLTKIIYFF